MTATVKVCVLVSVYRHALNHATDLVLLLAMNLLTYLLLQRYLEIILSTIIMVPTKHSIIIKNSLYTGP